MVLGRVSAFVLARSATALGLAIALLTIGCSKEPDRSTPEGTIQAAADAVKAGKASRLAGYVYADSDDMRRLLKRTGVFLGHIQDLALTLQQKFPTEVAELRSRTEQAAKEGKSTSLISQLVLQARPGGRRQVQVGVQSNDAARKAFDDALKELFVDPYGSLAQAQGRLTTAPINDDSVALMWDEKPILPPIGMTMRRDKDQRWYFALPTNIPGVSGFVPKTKEQYQIFGSLVTVFDKVVVDLRAEVESGRHKSLDSVASSAGEKVFIPAVMTVYAYGRIVDEQGKKPRPGAK